MKPMVVLGRMSVRWRQEQSSSGAHGHFCRVLQHFKAPLCYRGSFYGYIIPGFLAFSFFPFRLFACLLLLLQFLTSVLGQCSVFSYLVLNHSGARGGWHFVYTSAIFLPFFFCLSLFYNQPNLLPPPCCYFPLYWIPFSTPFLPLWLSIFHCLSSLFPP